MHRENEDLSQTDMENGGYSPLLGEFYMPYRPLSNLPTPPPSTRDASATDSPRDSQDGSESLHPRYRGPAIHLVNLIPASASLAFASVPTVQTLLGLADLPLETVALAVCILDSLNAKFARRWRVSCPIPGVTDSGSKRKSLPSTPSIGLLSKKRQQQLHIDSVKPEIIVLAAVVIAVKFVDDPQEKTQYYCKNWGQDMWSHEQLNATERCIMECLNYRILPLWEEGCIADAMVDMQLAARQEHQKPIWQPNSEIPLEWSRPRILDSEKAKIASAIGHHRSQTLQLRKHPDLGLGLTMTPCENTSPTAAQRATSVSSSGDI